MPTMRILILLSLASLTVGVIIHENVVFQKVNEITSTRAKWLVTFVHDLKPFWYFLQRVNLDILKADSVALTLDGRFTKSQQQGFRSTLRYLVEELQTLRGTQNSIVASFKDFKVLGSRSKRSILPLGGRILSFLFGTLSESDLQDVRKAINDLSGQQQSIIHIIEDQMTILNVTRVQISENRKAIIDLVSCLDDFEIRLQNLTVEIQKRLNDIEMFANLYAQMDLILTGIRDAIQRGTLYLQNLRLELNMLSLGRLSPSSITPKNLRKLLIQIRSKLPSTLKLPEDPRSNIWYFYRTLICTTILDDDKIIVVITVPLLDFTGEYEVFRVHNIPLPMCNERQDAKITSATNMVARYEVEYPGLLINKDRSKYTPLNEYEMFTCSNQVTRYCSPENAILPVNLNRLCILAL
ncbi:MAG: hypothetical protein ABW072_13270, partial [Sedimenticola sp.]